MCVNDKTIFPQTKKKCNCMRDTQNVCVEFNNRAWIFYVFIRVQASVKCGECHKIYTQFFCVCALLNSSHSRSQTIWFFSRARWMFDILFVKPWGYICYSRLYVHGKYMHCMRIYFSYTIVKKEKKKRKAYHLFRAYIFQINSMFVISRSYVGIF